MATTAKRKTRKTKRTVKAKAETQLRKRGSEALGFLLVLIGVAFAALLVTYSPADRSFSVATDVAPANMLGLAGSYIADPMHKAMGWAAFGIPLALVVWGVRLVLHSGQERALWRAIAVPPMIAVAAAFFATQVPPAGWAYEYGPDGIYGLGGLFGDTAIKAFFVLMPSGALGFNLLIVTLVLLVLTLLIGGYALGMNWIECKTCGRGMWRGFVSAYFGLRWVTVKLSAALYAILALLGVKGLDAAKNAREKRRARVADAAERREVGEVRVSSGIDDGLAPAEDRLSARISAAVRARKGKDAGGPALGGVQRGVEEPPMIARRATDSDDEVVDDGPMILNKPVPRVQHPTPKRAAKSVRARKEEQPSLALEPKEDGYETPPISILANPMEIVRHTLSDDALNENARMLENVLEDYGVKGNIIKVRPGPVVTMYELEPEAGMKASRVVGLADDIARSMSALSARISTIPGRSVIGIELPNDHREMVLFREIIAASAFGDSKFQLPLALGKDIGGEPVVANLAKMPHLLIAGTTGSGKSVGINTMILSLLYTLSPKECRMIMVDPKMLELSVYDGIPHLLSPVVTDPKKAVVALKWAVAEMEDRYRKMSKMGVRNIDGYNGRVNDALAKGEGFKRTIQTGFDDATGEPVFETEEFTPETMPFIVIIVDEMADLMMVAGKEIEACIMRLAQMARASGIHLIMATQRPSVDVITGTIKANFPTRISFQVTSKIDSRTILGEMGAEQLLGMGDMLYMAAGGKVTRVHGPFVSDEEVEEIVNFLKAQGEPTYVSGVVEGPEGEASATVDALLGLGGNTGGEDALYDQAVQIVARDRKCSTSYIQRKLSIGYNKAAKIVEEMEENGVVSQANHVGKREILVPEIQ
ncbi:MAG: cell division protein FtsK [Rhodobacteraceae bacterium]|nr:MAG: cell division protein FtsK [Paracoccaceae bacterium]